jgi:uncharacterized protein (DUF2267 family)
MLGAKTMFRSGQRACSGSLRGISSITGNFARGAADAILLLVVVGVGAVVVRHIIHSEMEGVRSDLNREMKGIRSDLNREMKELELKLNVKMDDVMDAVKYELKRGRWW